MKQPFVIECFETKLGCEDCEISTAVGSCCVTQDITDAFGCGGESALRIYKPVEEYETFTYVDNL
jgi:hypothetical protein